MPLTLNNLRKISFAVAGLLLPLLTLAQEPATPTTPTTPPSGTAAAVAPPPVAAPPPAPATTRELRYNLTPDGRQYFKVTFLNQTWLRYNESNPGTLVNSRPAPTTFDIGLRRTRIQLFGQIAPRTLLYMQFGQNNFNRLSANAGNRKLQAFFHDALGQYQVFEAGDKPKGKNYLDVGAGLTILSGLSRFTQPSVGTILSLDVPVFAQATVDQTDEFARKLSVYAHGQLGPLDYRVVLSDPFPIQTNGTAVPPAGPNATFANVGHSKQIQGFFKYNFFDHEYSPAPGYETGTYLGKKKVLNLEGGFITQPNATVTRTTVGTAPDSSSTVAFHDLNLWSVAAYLDMPLNAETGTALNAYAGYFNLDYGPGYLRYNGLMNPASGLAADAGPATSQGNAYPMFGTGQTYYGQLGYLLPRKLLGTGAGEGRGQLLPYGTVQVSRFERLRGGPMTVFDFGLNWLLNGHNSKITVDYQNRPTYTPTLERTGRRGSVTVQYQVFI